MLPADWNAEQALALAPTRTFRGTVWRVHWREVEPTDWSLSLRSSGRYHRGLDLFPSEQTFPALYTSLAPEIALWEMVRRSAARNLVYLKNNVLSELGVVLSRVLDLGDPALIGLTRSDLTGARFGRCQDLAAAAIARGAAGLLVPSAALPGRNLIIFPRNLDQPLPIQIVRRMELPLETIVGERVETGDDRS